MTKKKRWWEYRLYHFLQYRRWKKWRQVALKAINEKRCAKCVACDNPIVPGDFVGMPADLKVGSQISRNLIHAGLHFRIEDSDLLFCETGAIEMGIWNGMWVEKFSGLREPLAFEVASTGRAKSRSY